jgi:AraC family transcriptional regulator
MSSVTSVQSQPSGYFMQSTTMRAVSKHKFGFDRSGRWDARGEAVTDLSSIFPDDVVLSSQSLGWQNVRAIEMLHTTPAWTMPGFENHCIMVQLGPSVDVSAQIGDQTFDQSLEPGAITILPGGLPMHWSQGDGETNHALHLYLDPHFMRTIAESLDVDYNQISIAAQFAVRDEHIHHIAMALHYEMKEPNVIGRHYADALAKVLAMQLIRRYSYLKDLQKSRGGMAPRKLRKAIEFINENLDNEESLTLTTVAKEVQMSYSHFSRAFKQSMGISPNTYMTEQRIERAKKLLSETNLRIADIALRTGFASQSHFTSTFRRLVWTTPKAFRDTL